MMNVLKHKKKKKKKVTEVKFMRQKYQITRLNFIRGCQCVDQTFLLFFKTGF